MEALHPIQIERFRTMSFAEKWRVAMGLQRFARAVRTRSIQRDHPEWSPIQINQAVAREFTRSRT